MNFQTRIDQALSNKALRQNLRGAMDYLVSKRLHAIEDPDHWSKIREYASSIRTHVTHHLDSLLQELETNCLKNGIQVHWAEDASQANQIVLQIAHDKAASKVIKGKSMASEEIELNHFLAQHDITSIESDMGEFIVQLAKETPSHIIMPALHKNQHEIATLFEEELHENADPNDVDQLIGIGRKILREKFKHADIGLSGVNFALADTGTLCLVENEGNGRMSTTVPETHIAIMGLEKVIPGKEALPSLLHLLTRSATGQDITTYLNLISSPRKPNELDGPSSVHLIILDNGRSKIAADQKLRSTLSCIRCGACMNHCPVYTRIGGHAYGSTYPGPIGQVVSPQLANGEKYAELTSACSMNGACGAACPVKIDLPDLIRELRNHKAGKTWSGLLENTVWHFWRLIHRHPALYRLSLRCMASPLGRLLFPNNWLKTRTRPKAATKTLHDLVRERNRNAH